MDNNAKTTESLKERMADALLKLMSKKSFAKITVDEITDDAGVHRATWFRNFTSKNAAITYKIVQLWNRWASDHGLNDADRGRYTVDAAGIFFQFSYTIRRLLRTLCRAELQADIYDAFNQVMTPQFGTNSDESYQRRFFSYGLFGLLEEWIKRDFRETPEEMTSLFLKMAHA